MRVAENPEPDAAEDRPIELEVKSATTRVASKQLELQATLAKTHEDVNYLCKKKGQGLLGTEETVTLKMKQNKLDEMQRNLTKCKNNQTRQQCFHDNARTVHSLDDLMAALRMRGFHLSRSAVYLRLLPSNSATHEGKRHVKTVPVKLTRAQNDRHASHQDALFARATISNLEQLASLLGPGEVTFHSQDDKARVPIGLTAANKQAPLIMHLEYRVRLSDHDFVIAPKHKLVPSVIASITINKNT